MRFLGLVFVLMLLAIPAGASPETGQPAAVIDPDDDYIYQPFEIFRKPMRQVYANGSSRARNWAFGIRLS